MSNKSSSLVIQHAISRKTATHGIFQKSDCFLLKPNKLYMSADMPDLCKLCMLQLTKSSMNMINYLENFIEFINDNDGFTVVGWYKIGVINDESLIDSRKINNTNGGNTAANYNTKKEDIQVDSDEIIYHLVSINATNHESLYLYHQLGRYLCHLKFNVKKIVNISTVLFDWSTITLKMISQ